MRAPQPACRMLLQHLEHIAFVVLAAKHDKNAALGKMQQARLEIVEGLAGIFIAVELDRVQSLLADDAAPERIVAIEHEALLYAALEGADDARDVLGVEI